MFLLYMMCYNVVVITNVSFKCFGYGLEEILRRNKFYVKYKGFDVHACMHAHVLGVMHIYSVYTGRLRFYVVIKRSISKIIYFDIYIYASKIIYVWRYIYFEIFM